MQSPETNTLVVEGGVTQKQIAEQLGVSRQLVSFALRGQGRMSDATRQQIIEAAERGGYNQYSNHEARSMASKRYGKRAPTGVFAILFKATFEDQPLFNVPFFMPFFKGLEMEAAERGIELILCPLRPNELPRVMRERQVDGAICLLTPYETTQQINNMHLPMISVQYEVEQVPSLVIDDQAGTALATQHLIDLGHREIAFLGVAPPAVSGIQIENKRLNGYQRTLLKNGIAVENLLVDVNANEPAMQDGIDGMLRLLERSGSDRGGKAQLPFSGLVCYNDLIAMGAIRVLEGKGWKVPENISVIGFDDVSLQYGFTPALTSIRFPREEMARRAVRWLYEFENSAEVPTSWREAFPVELVERNSTRPFRDNLAESRNF